jgi:fucose permease
MSGLLFLYVGAEIGLGAWITAATRRAADTSVLVGALVTSAYWGALWLGRAASGRALEGGMASERILVFSIVGAGAGSVLLSLSGGVLVLGAAGAMIAGFCFGPIWPAALAIGTRGGPGNAAAAMVTLGNGGGVVLPWLQGRVLVSAGPRAGVAVSALLCAGMLALAAASLRGRPTDQAARTVSS